MILVEDIGDFFLIEVDGDLVHRLHDLGQRRLAGRSQQVTDRHGTDRLVGRIHHIDVEEQLGQFVGVPSEMIDGLADRPELRRGHHLALHQAPGGLILIGQGGFNRGPFQLGHGGQHLGAFVILQIVDDVGRVVGVHLADGLGQGGGRHVLQHVLADLTVQFGQDFCEGLGIQVRDQLFARIG